jgi:hypothetical protein
MRIEGVRLGFAHWRGDLGEFFFWLSMYLALHRLLCICERLAD